MNVLGSIAKLLKSFEQSSELEELQLELTLGIGSESEKRAFLSMFSGFRNSYLSFHLQSFEENGEAARLALITALRYKRPSIGCSFPEFSESSAKPLV
jgi:hypothetical protein